MNPLTNYDHLMNENMIWIFYIGTVIPILVYCWFDVLQVIITYKWYYKFITERYNSYLKNAQSL